MKRFAWFLVVLGVVCAGLFAALAAAPAVARAAAPLSSTPDPHLWVTDGNVFAIAPAPDGSVYIGGAFDYVGPLTGGGAMLQASGGALKSRLGEGPGGVEVALPDGAGGDYIGGDFTRVGGLVCNHLAHILANYSSTGPSTPTPTTSSSPWPA